jgi:uncharacterized membrane protein YoaK (UPF0700 family)
MAEKPHITWLSCGLAFVGGYGDAASFILANTFTGHITGNFVLIAISLASHDWPTFFRRGLAIAIFLLGVLLSIFLEQRLAPKQPRSFLPVVLGLEIVLVSTACLALASPLAARLELFVICLALALGLQNGAWRKAGGLTVHSTYLTGMVTHLLTIGAQRFIAKPSPKSAPDPQVSLLWGMWVAFIVGGTVGAALVLRFAGLGILGAALMLLALIMHQFITARRP